MNLLSNWKTSIAGIATAVLLVVLTFVLKHTIDPETLTLAVGIATTGILASDSSSATAFQSLGTMAAKLPFFSGALAQGAVKVSDAAFDLASKDHPTNILLSNIASGIDALNSSLSSTSTAPIAITNSVTAEQPTVNAQPEPIAAPITEPEPSPATGTAPTDLEKAQAALKLAQDAVAALTPAPQPTTDINNING